MAWNQPNSAADGSAASKGCGKSSAAKWAVAALLLFAAAGGAVWWFAAERRSAEPEKPGRKPGRIEEAKPAAAPKPKPRRSKDLTNEERLQRIRARYGDNIPENLKATVYFLENPPQQTYHPTRGKTSIFKHRSERVIASLISATPGDFMLRRNMYDSRFDDDFAKSLKERIEFSDDDTPEQRALKQAVAETKEELADRMKSGVRPSELLNSITENLYDLGRYRRDLEVQLSKFKRDAKYSDEDIADFVTAANQMLKKKGAKEIAMPNMLLRHMSLRNAARREAAKQQQKEESK